MQLPIVINSNFARISYRFRDMDAFCSKTASFFTPTLVWCPPSWGTPCYMNVIYTAGRIF